jgi:hypothetical protein
MGTHSCESLIGIIGCFALCQLYIIDGAEFRKLIYSHKIIHCPATNLLTPWPNIIMTIIREGRDVFALLL